ncbi:PaaD-like zinc ribbon domain-containing protein [Siminovitchia terrae]|uniref:PaaD-like zinc ribbon domain-containing protein n=1 Tax=Siminovitchia terrae TaxID=1914933 RepID=UPI004032E036
MFKIRSLNKDNNRLGFLKGTEVLKLKLISEKVSVSPRCSFCESEDVSRMASFGTAQLVSQYYCNNCRSVFEFIRWQKAD